MTTPLNQPGSIDPVCGMVAAPDSTHLVHEGVAYAFCEDACAETFAADPSRWALPFEHTAELCHDVEPRNH